MKGRASCLASVIKDPCVFFLKILLVSCFIIKFIIIWIGAYKEVWEPCFIYDYSLFPERNTVEISFS